jgi:hypothetical protein
MKPDMQELAEAAEHGRDAYVEGDPFLRNPYDRTNEPQLWDAWRAGYLMMLKETNK